MRRRSGVNNAAMTSVETTTARGDCSTPVSAPNSRCRSTTLPKYTSASRHGQDRVDQRLADDDIDVEEPVAQHSDAQRHAHHAETKRNKRVQKVGDGAWYVEEDRDEGQEEQPKTGEHPAQPPTHLGAAHGVPHGHGIVNQDHNGDDGANSHPYPAKHVETSHERAHADQANRIGHIGKPTAGAAIPAQAWETPRQSE